MPYFTTTEWVIVALVLVAGWLLGLASSSGGKKWKERYLAEREAHATYRQDADARVADAERRHAELERRHVELERDHTRVLNAPPAAPATDTRPVADRSVRPISATVISPSRTHTTGTTRSAHQTGERRGWFDFAGRGTTNR